MATLLACPAVTSAQPLTGVDIPALRAEVAAERVARARALESAGRALDAEASYREAMTADPSRLDAFLGYARLLRLRGRGDEAAATLRAVSPRALADDDALTTLTDAWVALGRADEAAALLRAHGRGPAAWRALATLATRQGAFAEALAASRRVLDAGDASRAAGLTVRALAQLSAEVDVVRRPPAGTTAALRRWLAGDRGEPAGW